MKRTIMLVSAAALVGVLFAFGSCAKKSEPQVTAKTAQETIILTMGSWRTDDVVQMTALLDEYKKIKPTVTIQFRPTNPPDYNETLRAQLDSGAGPDLMYARSYALGQELFEAGYFGDCSDISGVSENFTPSNTAPWRTGDGRIFAVPFAAVSHAVYYNKTIFQKEGLSTPPTWEDFLALCAALASKGYTPLANGIADEWDILEAFYFGMLPNFIGGAAERARYESGEKKLNDANFEASFQAMRDVAPYLPQGFGSVSYAGSQELFNSQQAVMFMDGSWTAGAYKNAAFEWGVFAMPAPQGRATLTTFHPDMAIAYNLWLYIV